MDTQREPDNKQENCTDCQTEPLAKGKCRRCYNREYYREYYKRFPEKYAKLKESSARWHKEHPEYMRQWNKENPDYGKNRKKRLKDARQFQE